MGEKRKVDLELMCRLVSNHWDLEYSKSVEPSEIYESIEDEPEKLLEWFEKAVYYFSIRQKSDNSSLDFKQFPVRFNLEEYDRLWCLTL